MVESLHLLLTYHCTHECDHCFVRSGPGARGTFTPELLDGVIAEAKKLGTVGSIWFEGGEPFLYYPLLLEGVRRAADAGLDTGIVTNCYWAESESTAELFLRPLFDAGLTDFFVSDDAFHHGEENPSTRAVAAAERLGRKARAICIPPPEEADGVTYRGRAAEKLTEGRPMRPAAEFAECPDEDLESPGRVHLDAYGNVHICQGISMGNFRERPLSEILANWDPRSHPICGPLLEGGPARLAEVHDLEEHAAVSACHLCTKVREALLDAYPDSLAPRQLYGDAENASR